MLKAKTLFTTLLLLSTAVAADVTLTGRVTASSEPTWAWAPVADGQVTAALSWKKKSANLFVLLACSDGLNLLPFGLGLADGNDRFQRIEASQSADTECMIGVASRKGSSAFSLHVVGVDRLQKVDSPAFKPADEALIPVFSDLLAQYRWLGRQD